MNDALIVDQHHPCDVIIVQYEFDLCLVRFMSPIQRKEEVMHNILMNYLPEKSLMLWGEWYDLHSMTFEIYLVKIKRLVSFDIHH